MGNASSTEAVSKTTAEFVAAVRQRIAAPWTLERWGLARAGKRVRRDTLRLLTESPSPLPRRAPAAATAAPSPGSLPWLRTVH
jgi:hypothetical protein